MSSMRAATSGESPMHDVGTAPMSAATIGLYETRASAATTQYCPPPTVRFIGRARSTGT
jgi:hypothetical protein